MRLWTVFGSFLGMIALSLPVAHAAGIEPAPLIADQASEVPADVEFTLAADWNVGDSYRIEQLSEREEIRNGAHQPSRSSRSLLRVTVEEKGEYGYVLASTLIESDLSNYATPEEGGAQAASMFAKLFEGMRSELVTNEHGVPVGLRNRDEVVDLMRRAMNGLAESRTTGPEHRKRTMAIMEQMLTAEFIEAMATKDAIVFYGLLGGTYRGGPPEVLDVALPHPFSQSMIDAELHVLLRRIETDTGLVHISTQSLPDGEQLKRVTEDWLKSVMQAQGQQPPPGFDFPELYMRDTTYYVFDRTRSLPVEVTFERFLRFGDQMTRLDRESFRLLPSQ